MPFNKKTVIKVVSLILAICILAVPFSASAASKSELNSKISSLEKQANEINKKINSLKGNINKAAALKAEYDKQIANLEDQIGVYEDAISKYNSEIKALEKEIKEKEDAIEAQKTLLKQRIRAIVMLGEGEMSFFVGGENFSDYLSKQAISKRVSAFDNSLIDSFNKAIIEIEAKKATLNDKKAELDTAKSSLDSKRSELAAKRKTVNSELSSLYSKSSDLKNDLAAVEKAKQKYEDEVQRLIREAEGNTPSSQKYTGGALLWPVPNYYTVTSPYGYRTHPISGQYKFHKGIDISGSGIGGKPIVAAADGTVTTAGYNTGGYGNYVVINHGYSNGKLMTTHYGHMRSIAVSTGQTVKRGQVIGYVGTTGSSTGNHLHFEVRFAGETTNPMNFFS